MVDVFGIRRVNDYLAWIEEKLYLQEVKSPDVVQAAVTADELLKTNEHHHFYGDLNQWEHACSFDFVAEGKRRAFDLIGECCERYKVSILKAAIGRAG